MKKEKEKRWRDDLASEADRHKIYVSSCGERIRKEGEERGEVNEEEDEDIMW